MISIHIEGQTPDEIKGILAGLAAHYAEPAPAAPKPAKVAGNSPVPAPVAAAPAPPAPVTAPVVAEAPAPVAEAAPLHTRDSIKAAIKAANLPKPLIVTLLATVSAKKLDEVADDKVQAFGEAVAAAVKTTATPAPAAAGNSPVPEATPTAPGEKKWERGDVTAMAADIMGWNRSRLVDLLVKYDTKKLGTLPDDKLNAFGNELALIHEEEKKKVAAAA